MTSFINLIIGTVVLFSVIWFVSGKRWSTIDLLNPEYLSNLSNDDRLEFTNLPKESLLKLWKMIAFHYYLNINSITVETNLKKTVGGFFLEVSYPNSFLEGIEEEFEVIIEDFTTVKDLIREIENKQLDYEVY